MRVALFLVFGLSAFWGCKNSDDPVPILTPEEAIRDFQVEEGFQVELVAAEPQVVSPVALNFDERGRMWVVEMPGYMPNINGTGEDKPIGRVRILQDNDGDGFYESVQTFMDGLVQPRALSFAKGGVLLAEPPNLWFVPVQNDKPGQKVLIDSTYADVGNVEHQPNGLLRAMDNWIYSAKGEVRYRQTSKGWLREEAVFRGQWGISQDNSGRLYYNNNSTTLLGDAYLPAIFPPNIHHEQLAKDTYNRSLVKNTVFPRRATIGVNRGYEKEVLDASGKLRNVTSACGPVIYRGDQFPEHFQGDAFVMEPVGYLVKHIKIWEENNVPMGSFENGREFLTATDERFRPVNAHNAPDGTLFVVDMHSGIIQHATYMTPYLRKHIEQYRLDKPTGMGRIYRVRYKNKPLSKGSSLANATITQLVSELSHPNGWRRDTAQRLLVEQGNPTAISLLLNQAQIGPSIAKLHALWTLEGLEALKVEDLESVWQTSPENVVRETILHQMGILAKHEQYKAAAKWLQTNVPKNNENIHIKAVWLSSIAKHAVQNPSLWPHTLPMLAEANTHTVLIDGLLSNVAGKEAQVLRALENRAPKVVLEALRKALAKSKAKPEASLLHLSKQERGLFNAGKGNYGKYCATCHGENGEGLENLAPPLAGSEWVNNNAHILGRIVLDGLTGPISVHQKQYTFNSPMPAFRQNIEVNNEALASILTFIRNSWGNKGTAVFAKDLILLRAETKDRTMPYTAEELRALKPNPRQISYLYKKTQSKRTTQIKPRWRKLFDGKTLNGWHVVGGKATYRIENGEIVGQTTRNTPNTFLATNERFGDFVLELEVKVDTLLNSGIQIRSNTYPDYLNGLVHGYQIEIDPSKRAWSGGIYDENRRLWMYSLQDKPLAQRAFRNNQWNHYRIEAIGIRIRTWINGIPVADLNDGLTLSGFIGLQVHGIGTDATKEKRDVRWRNIRIMDFRNTTWFANSDLLAHPISAVNDENEETYWQSAALDSWIEADFKHLRRVSSVQLGFHLATERRYKFRIIGSKDGKKWKTLIETASAAKSGLQTFHFSPVRMRYIRVVGLGHQNGRENAYTTFRIP